MSHNKNTKTAMKRINALDRESRMYANDRSMFPDEFCQSLLHTYKVEINAIRQAFYLSTKENRLLQQIEDNVTVLYQQAMGFTAVTNPVISAIDIERYIRKETVEKKIKERAKSIKKQQNDRMNTRNEPLAMVNTKRGQLNDPYRIKDSDSDSDNIEDTKPVKLMIGFYIVLQHLADKYNATNAEQVEFPIVNHATQVEFDASKQFLAEWEKVGTAIDMCMGDNIPSAQDVRNAINRWNDFLLANHISKCPKCNKNGPCECNDYAFI